MAAPPRYMRAIRLSSYVDKYADLKVSRIPTPTPTQDQTLVRVQHVSINYVDLLYSRGKHQNNRRHVKPPFTLGLEFAGEVVACPAGTYAVGAKVYGGAPTGAFADYIAIATTSLRPLPTGWTTRDACGLAATAPVSYGALVRVAGIKRGDTVLVHAAAGGLGCMAVQIAQACGATVIATVGSAAKAAVVHEKLGIPQHAVVRYDIDGWEERVRLAAGGDGEGVDVTFDSVGLVESSIRCSRYGACVLVVGFAGRDATTLEQIAANRILLKSIRVIGYRFGEHGRRFPDETEATWTGLEEMLKAGQVRSLIFDGTYRSLEDVPRAMQDLADRKTWGKVVVSLADAVRSARL